MKPEFSAIPIECWLHRGARLDDRALAVCLFHWAVGEGVQLLLAIDELKASAPMAKRTLTFRCSGREHGVSTLRLRLQPTTDDLRVMYIGCEDEAASIVMTMQGLEILREGVELWLKGGEDFRVGPGKGAKQANDRGSLDRSSGSLWFWGPTMEP